MGRTTNRLETRMYRLRMRKPESQTGCSPDREKGMLRRVTCEVHEQFWICWDWHVTSIDCFLGQGVRDKKGFYTTWIELSWIIRLDFFMLSCMKYPKNNQQKPNRGIDYLLWRALLSWFQQTSNFERLVTETIDMLHWLSKISTEIWDMSNWSWKCSDVNELNVVNFGLETFNEEGTKSIWAVSCSCHFKCWATCM